MPVRVQCDDCGEGFSVPDAARGKAVKCKSCGGRVPVPKGGSKPRRKKAARPRKSVEDEDFFTSLNLDHAEDVDVRVCIKCAAEVDEEDIECPECGVNLETGELSEKKKRLKKFKGPDPDEFYKVVWSNSWDFLKKNIGLTFRIALTWSFFNALAIGSALLFKYYLFYVPAEDEKYPWPLTAFWALITTVTSFATMGVYWQTFLEVIKATGEKKDELKRFNLDFFSCVALGLKLYFWPVVMMSPFILPIALCAVIVWFLSVFAGQDAISVWQIVGASFYVPAILFFPIAISHMTAKYTYKAYTLYHLVRIFFKNIKAVFMWWLVALAVLWPIIGVVVGLGIGGDRLLSEFHRVNLTLLSYVADVEEQGLWFKMCLPFTSIPILFVASFLVSMLHSFSGVFLMRATGLFTYYNKRTLEMSEKRIGDQPADFWVRYLQFVVDWFIVTALTGVAQTIVLLVFGFIESFDVEMPTLAVIRFVGGLIPFCYFVLSESGPSKATLGMHGVGIYVIDQYGNSPISKGAAVSRYFLRTMILGLSGLGMLFDKHKRTLHDQASKTHVVWRPEVH